MPAPTLNAMRLGLATTVAVLAVVSCADTPTTVGVADGKGNAPAFSQAENKNGKPFLHLARVKADGTLVDGTALSSSRVSHGSYVVSFPPPIDKCAASVTGAAFAGYDSTVSVIPLVLIGLSVSGANNTDVIVQLLNQSGEAPADASFTLTLVCL